MDQRVLGTLGRMLSLELTAAQSYGTQARLVATWGLDGPAGRLRATQAQALARADQLIGRMLALGVAPSASQLRPALIGPDLLSLLVADQALEADRTRLCADAAAHAARTGSAEDRVFFQALLGESQAASAALDQWIAELAPARAGTGRAARTSRQGGGAQL